MPTALCSYPASLPRGVRRACRNRRPSASGVILAALLAALVLPALGCGSLPGVGGGGGGSTLPDDRLTGEVDRVDTSRRQIVLITTGERLSTGGDRVALDYDDRTRVVYRGDQYTPANLEPGDEVRAEVERDGGTLYTPYLEVLRSVSGPPATGGDELSVIEGEVDRVDTGRREIAVDTTGGLRYVLYEADTPVWYRGERYEATNLDPGDEVRIEVTDGGRTPLAERIDVVQAVQETGGTIGDGSPNGTAAATLSGTVEWIDSRRGELGVRTDSQGVVTVVLPFNADPRDRDVFDDLREGDRVRLDADEVSRGRYELVRFR